MSGNLAGYVFGGFVIGIIIFAVINKFKKSPWLTPLKWIKLQKMGQTYKKTYKKLHKGKSLKEIAYDRNLSKQTIKRHYAKLKEKGII